MLSIRDGWRARLLLQFIRPCYMKSKGLMIGSWGHVVYEEMLYTLYILPYFSTGHEQSIQR